MPCHSILWPLVGVLFFSSSGWGHTVNYAFSSYQEAKESQSQIQFKMKTTQVGILTSSVEGVVKKFSVNYELDDSGVRSARITIPIAQLDTDLEKRDSTIKEDCFNFRKFPEITVLVADPIPIDGQEHTVQAVINLRGQTKPILLKISAQREGRKILATLAGQLSLKDLEIPSPSTLLARVHDKIELKAQLEANE